MSDPSKLGGWTDNPSEGAFGLDTFTDEDRARLEALVRDFADDHHWDHAGPLAECSMPLCVEARAALKGEDE